MSVPFVLPHEILHHVAMAGEYQAHVSTVHSLSLTQNVAFPCQFSLSMLGNRSEDDLKNFWDHCSCFDEWSQHEVLMDPTPIDRKRFLSDSNFIWYLHPLMGTLCHSA